MWYEMEESDRMNLSRIRQAKATGAKTVATGCSFCMIMLDDAVKVEVGAVQSGVRREGAAQVPHLCDD